MRCRKSSPPLPVHTQWVQGPDEDSSYACLLPGAQFLVVAQDLLSLRHPPAAQVPAVLHQKFKLGASDLPLDLHTEGSCILARSPGRSLLMVVLASFDKITSIALCISSCPSFASVGLRHRTPRDEG